jgi:O-6-methylguanine DNA methyltransferase
MSRTERTPGDPRPGRPAGEAADLTIVEAALRELGAEAPRDLAPRTLVEVGLADSWDLVETPAGRVVVAWNGRGIAMVDLAGDHVDFERRHLSATARPLATAAPLPPAWRRAIERRLAGDRRIRIPLDLRGHTDFERSVWQKALEIPAGEVRPYGWVAAEIGHPRAVRAVGTALGHNPVPLVVPCHRVVRSDGSIGEYSLGGPSVKRRLLTAEGVDLDELETLTRRGIRYIGSATTRIYCLPTCRHARRIAPANRVPFRTSRDGEVAGYRACRDCRPRIAA